MQPRLYVPPKDDPAPLDWRAGDLLLFYGRDWMSRAIEIGTWGPSHVGMICNFRQAGPQLVESTTLCDLPDSMDFSFRKGVQFHDPFDRIRAYAGRIERMRLADGWWLDNEEKDVLCRWLIHVRGLPYDLRGALISGTRVFKWTSLAPYADRSSLFCSELCAGALMRLGRLPLSNPSAYNPASLARRLQRCGTYSRPEPLVLPSAA